MQIEPIVLKVPVAVDYVGVHSLIERIGDASFEGELMEQVHSRFHVDYLHIFRLKDGFPNVIASVAHDGTPAAAEHAAVYRKRQIWRADNAMLEASRTPPGKRWLYHLDTQSLSRGALRSYRLQMHLRSRTMIIGHGSAGVVGMSMVWSSGSGGAGQDLSFFDLAFAILSKHLAVREDHIRLTQSLRCLSQIETRLYNILGGARPREIEVASRLLFGQSANDVAADLGVSKETIATHRKRLYERLGVRGGRDLLLWYLSQ